MRMTINQTYGVEPHWFLAVEMEIRGMFKDLLDKALTEVYSAARNLYSDTNATDFNYKDETYSFYVENLPRKLISIYRQDKNADIIHDSWNTFKEPMLLAKQCFAIATFHECSQEFLSMKDLDIPQRQKETVKRFYEDFHALHALITIRGLNE